MRFNVSGFKKSFKRVGEAVKNLILTDSVKRRILRDVGEEERREAQRRIRVTKRDPDGKPWAPWAMSTIEARQRRGTHPGGGILFEFGKLYRSLKVQVGRNVVAIFSNTKYGKYHQRGSGHLPKREFLGFNRKSIQQVRNKFRRFYRGGRL